MYDKGKLCYLQSLAFVGTEDDGCDDEDSQEGVDGDGADDAEVIGGLGQVYSEVSESEPEATDKASKGSYGDARTDVREEASASRDHGNTSKHSHN